MNLIDQTYFEADLYIAQKTAKGVGPLLDLFIQKFEKECLQKLLGYDLWKQFTEGLEEDSPAQIWIDLRDGVEYTGYDNKLHLWMGFVDTENTAPLKQSIIANYVYFEWMTNQQSSTTGSGEAVSTKENAESFTAAYKMEAAWNDVIEWQKQLNYFLRVKKADYPVSYQSYRVPSEFHHSANALGI